MFFVTTRRVLFFYLAITLDILNTGRRSAIAIVPITPPIIVIINGSMSAVVDFIELWSFFS